MKKQNGFNLVEVLVVMAIIGIIAGIGWPMYTSQLKTNNRTDAILATNAVALALAQYQSDNGNYKWDANPGAATVANAHNRYMPMVPVGAASGTTADAVCAKERGFRWVPGNARYESCHGLYSITVAIGGTIDPDGGGSSYTITTTAIPGLSQDIDANNNDDECNAFTLTSNGVKGHIAKGYPLTNQAGPTSDGAFHSTKRCWGSD